MLKPKRGGPHPRTPSSTGPDLARNLLYWPGLGLEEESFLGLSGVQSSSQVAPSRYLVCCSSSSSTLPPLQVLLPPQEPPWFFLSVTSACFCSWQGRLTPWRKSRVGAGTATPTDPHFPAVREQWVDRHVECSGRLVLLSHHLVGR